MRLVEFCGVVRRSGSGKSTAVKLTNGMLFCCRGEWNPIAVKRRIGHAIQDAGLFPHFTVARNVGLVPSLAGWKEQDAERRLDELLIVADMRTWRRGREPRRG